MKIACGIEYDGTDYRGFQRQPSMHGQTIQRTLESVIERISGEMSTVYGAGRTDAGVHARGQVVHFCTDAHLQLYVWMRAINALLPSTLAVRWVQEVPDHFHARFRALSRSYRYTIWNDMVPSPLLVRYSYHRPQALDVDLMHAACQLLAGRKDFGAFGRSPDDGNRNQLGPHHCIRTILSACCLRHETQKIVFCDLTADAFLTGMVRRIVGTLVWVGLKRLSLEEFATIVQRAKIIHSIPLAPAQGLCLERVTYPEEYKL